MLTTVSLASARFDTPRTNATKAIVVAPMGTAYGATLRPDPIRAQPIAIASRTRIGNASYYLRYDPVVPFLGHNDPHVRHYNGTPSAQADLLDEDGVLP